MLTNSKTIAFIGTTNPDHARAFYRDILGLRLVSEDPFALMFDSNGTPLRVVVVEKVSVAPYTVLGWLVSDVGTAVRALSERGVSFLRFDGMEQDERGIWNAPGGARVAWFNDPEGHVLSLTQE